MTLIALGSNDGSFQGDAAANIAWAVSRIAPLAQGPVSVSPFYATPAYPTGSGPDFVNAAMAFVTGMDAVAILETLHGIEAEAGRSRAVRWGQRNLDLDLIAVADQVLPDATTQDHWRGLPQDLQAATAPDRLILPHPRVQDRSFVLVPLADVAPGWRHPLLGLSVVQMLDRLPEADRAGVVRLTDSSAKG
ncbi:2-amino-4-hydroxy-6-hydroxymethyldihydropteridine diphosphokinase [Yoonia vestfoldensis]|uniref:2-amino-4-hydroxy-6- hydroxymethyldihydropteridine diphosphokinase n=1 Tax=Yoonia vestfoldensis TaxID=245188 RepID=UPI001FE234B0|nr:2-amino-4-hydroxy-6-hydroxymethyldihydropteridine diphosphokinase [Yoonia vestfoldensis]